MVVELASERQDIWSAVDINPVQFLQNRDATEAANDIPDGVPVVGLHVVNETKLWSWQ